MTEYWQLLRISNIEVKIIEQPWLTILATNHGNPNE